MDFALPDHLAQVVWRGEAMGRPVASVVASGHPELDKALPGGGWPCRSMTEVLLAQSAQAEWRLLSPALAPLVRHGGSIMLINPPHWPHLPGLRREGLHDEQLILIDARQPAERLWATEQALKSGCVSAVLSWLPQAQPEHIRRLQVCALSHPGLFFVFRPLLAQAQASAAPLRLALSLGPCPHPLSVQIIKRRGPAQVHPLKLAHWPAGLPPLLAQARWPVAPPSTISPRHLDLPDTAPPPSPHHAALDRTAPRASKLHL